MTATASIVSTPASDRLRAALKQYWGYDSFRPLQQRAMECALAKRDSVVVLPTGGGKSLCYQAPAVCLDGLTVVISPLISLMKDQVDALTSCGIPAACANSASSLDEKRQAADEIRAGRLKLLYLSPERIVQGQTLEFLRHANVQQVAIDEAHCISAWGHDFRPEYRQLQMLRATFPEAGVHAFTATATEQVRNDIAAQLGLSAAEMIVGSFDRPNLVYRVRRQSGVIGQVCDVIERHRGEAGIIYCITRKKVEEVASALTDLGHHACPYHAGMSDEDRQQFQNEFAEEKVDIIVATIAFGMGIDKSNVRYVVHVGLPKSLENYQQESGRAGRDGLEAECWLFYSLADVKTWEFIFQNAPPTAAAANKQALKKMLNYTGATTCRHCLLVDHFGQSLDGDNCGACDVCLNEIGSVEDPLVLAQKIISCVARVDQRFGADHVAKVLSGSQEARIMQLGHNELSTWGLLKEHSKQRIRDWIEQLVSQGFLIRGGEYQTLSISDTGWQVLSGEAIPRLMMAEEDPQRESAVELDAWEGVDRDLFAALRILRRELADEKGVPAYIVFSDAALRDMARRRPSTVARFLQVQGVGQLKQQEYGQTFIDAIVGWCEQERLETDVVPNARPMPQPRPRATNSSAIASFEYFRAGMSVPQVAEKVGRAESTTQGYLIDYINHEQICDASRWVDYATIERICSAAAEQEDARLKPIFEALDEEVSYEEIRIVMTCLRNETAAG